MIGIKEAVAGAGEIPAKSLKSCEEYGEFRANKQFIQSDALRKEIEGVRI